MIIKFRESGNVYEATLRPYQNDGRFSIKVIRHIEIADSSLAI